MKYVVNGVCSLLFLLGTTSVVHAQIDLDLPGLDVAIDGDDVTVDAGDVDISVSDSANSVEIDTGETGVSVSETGAVDVVTPDAVVEVGTSGDVGIRTDEVGVDVSEVGALLVVEEGLSVQLETGSVTAKTAEMLLEIDATDEVLIQTEADVAAYAEIAAASNPAVAGVRVATDDVRVAYQETGNLLGIFPVSYESTVVVTNDGSVSIEAPWYSFVVFGTQSNAIKNQVVTGVNSAAVVIDDISLRRASNVDVAVDAVRSQVIITDSKVEVETNDAAVDVDADSTNIEVQGSDGEYIRITDDMVNISL